MPLLTTQDFQQMEEFAKQYCEEYAIAENAACHALRVLHNGWKTNLGDHELVDSLEDVRRTIDILQTFQGFLSRLHPINEEQT